MRASSPGRSWCCGGKGGVGCCCCCSIRLLRTPSAIRYPWAPGGSAGGLCAVFPRKIKVDGPVVGAPARPSDEEERKKKKGMCGIRSVRQPAELPPHPRTPFLC